MIFTPKNQGIHNKAPRVPQQISRIRKNIGVLETMCLNFFLFFRSPCSPMTTRWKGFFSERNSRTMMCSLVYWTTFKLGSSQGKTISEWPLQYMCTILQWVTVINYFLQRFEYIFFYKKLSKWSLIQCHFSSLLSEHIVGFLGISF